MTKINVSSYTMVAEARGQQVIFFREYGSYQGEWLLVSKDKEHYYIYKDSYGSCSGCDAIQGEFHTYDAEYDSNDEVVQEFIKDYQPFITLTPKEALSLAKDGTLGTVIPANMRGDYEDIDYDEFVKQVSILIKSFEGEVEAKELLDLDNAESKREAIERYGEEKFVKDTKGEVINKDGNNSLLVVSHTPENFVFLNLKDASTPRRYVLRVPPTTKTVKEGIAWSFNLDESVYKPLKET